MLVFLLINMLYLEKDTIVSSGAIVVDKNLRKVLVILDKKRDGEIYFPKGRVEKYESNEEAARREVLEEAGVICNSEPLSFLAMEVRYSKAINKTKVIYWYLAYFGENKSSALEDHEFFERKWINFDEAATALSFEDDKRLLASCNVF